MPSFDVVSEVDLHELRNAVDQAGRELRSRFDFRGVDASFDLVDAGVQLLAREDFQLRQMEDILRDRMARRSLDGACLAPGDIEGAGKQRRRLFGLKQGIDRDTAKKIVRMIKDLRLKVQAQINGPKLRVTGKKRDDLQQVMAMLRDTDLDVPLQFDNYRD